jgi:hypothetical protein
MYIAEANSLTKGETMPKKIEIEKEITPSHLRCFAGSCPAVYTLSDGNLLIIGKKPSDTLYKQVEAKVADDEFAVVLSPEFFQKI